MNYAGLSDCLQMILDYSQRNGTFLCSGLMLVCWKQVQERKCHIGVVHMIQYTYTDISITKAIF